MPELQADLNEAYLINHVNKIPRVLSIYIIQN